MPDVALLDIGLPVRDGFEVARILRGDLRTAGTVLIAVSGYAQPEDRKRSSEAGFFMHLAKPVDLGELAQALRRMTTAGTPSVPDSRA